MKGPLFGGCALLAAISIMVSSHPAPAMSLDNAIAACKAKAKPGVQHCVRGKMQASGLYQPKKYIEQCRAQARPDVQACVRNKMQSG
jgi:hypothetical protein